MKTQKRFGRALQALRKMRGLTQEDFSLVSSRTYLSVLEHGSKSPTMSKLEELAELLEVHPVTLCALGYAPRDKKGIDALCEQIRMELLELATSRTAS